MPEHNPPDILPMPEIPAHVFMLAPTDDRLDNLALRPDGWRPVMDAKLVQKLGAVDALTVGTLGQARAMDDKILIDGLPVIGARKGGNVAQGRGVLMIEVKRSQHLRVREGGGVERPQIRGMLIAVHHDNVALVHLPYGPDATEMEGVEAGHLGWELGIRLVEHFISQDGWFVMIAAGDFTP